MWGLQPDSYNFLVQVLSVLQNGPRMDWVVISDVDDKYCGFSVTAGSIHDYNQF